MKNLNVKQNMIWAMLKNIRILIYCTSIILFIIISKGNTYATTIATQDLFIFDSLRINSGGGQIDFAPILVASSLSSLGDSIAFPGGATFSATSIFKGLAADIDLYILQNTTVTPGVISFGGNKFFSILTSSDLDSRAETIGISDTVEIDLTSVLPADVNVGDVGQMDYTFLQFTMPSDQGAEMGLSPMEIALLRANEGLIQIPSIDGTTVTEVFNQPFMIAEGSDALRYFGKGLVVVGGTVGGALGGAAVGSAVPGLGTAAGGIWGGISGFLGGLGGMIVANTEGDHTTDKKVIDITPSSKKAIPTPEPSTYLLFLFGMLGLAGIKKKGWIG